MRITFCLFLQIDKMDSRDFYQQNNERCNQTRAVDQTELYEYENQSNSTTNRLGNNILQKSSEGIQRASNLLDTLPSNVNRTLLYAKLFYFWYFAAFGSLFPLMSIYFKQMGMGPSYCGILMGFR